MASATAKAENNRAFVIKPKDDNTDELYSFGTLIENRSEDGELLLMLIEPILVMSDDDDKFSGDLLLYFAKTRPDLYEWANFEDYFEWLSNEQYDTSFWKETIKEISLDDGDLYPSRDRAELQRVLEDAEKTIELVRGGKPIQTLIWRSSKVWQKVNEVRRKWPPRNPFRIIASAPLPPANCDVVGVNADNLKQIVQTALTGGAGPICDIMLLPSGRRHPVEIKTQGANRGYKISARGDWSKKIIVDGHVLLNAIEHEVSSTLRLTYIAGRLFVRHTNIPAREQQD
jgi:hypothetical protein